VIGIGRQRGVIARDRIVVALKVILQQAPALDQQIGARAGGARVSGRRHSGGVGSGLVRVRQLLPLTGARQQAAQPPQRQRQRRIGGERVTRGGERALTVPLDLQEARDLQQQRRAPARLVRGGRLAFERGSIGARIFLRRLDHRLARLEEVQLQLALRWRLGLGLGCGRIGAPGRWRRRTRERGRRAWRGRRARGNQRLPWQLLELYIDKLVVVAVAVGSGCHAVLAVGHYRYPWIIVSIA